MATGMPSSLKYIDDKLNIVVVMEKGWEAKMESETCNYIRSSENIKCLLITKKWGEFGVPREAIVKAAALNPNIEMISLNLDTEDAAKMTGIVYEYMTGEKTIHILSDIGRLTIHL